MEIGLLKDLIIIFGLAIVVTFVFSRLRVPVVVGLLITGVLCGPQGLRLVHATHEVEVMAEIGVVLLLFTIGIEFSFESLVRIKRAALLGGLLQVGLSFLAGAAITLATGRDTSQAVFFGMLLALSSTVIVLKLLQDRAEMDSPHGKVALGVLIFQDIAVVPMVLIVPLLGGGEGDFLNSMLMMAAKAGGVLVLVFLLARYVVPVLLYQVAKLQFREVFLLSIIFIGMGVAFLTYRIGLSPALGAFLAGLIISESEYSQKALSDLLPFRDVFISLFFVSIGMLLDTGFVLDYWMMLIPLAMGVILVKSLLAGASTIIIGLPLRVAVLAGIWLSQVGEFSFILAKTGMDYDLMDKSTFQVFLAVSIFTMMATPLIGGAAPRLADLVMKLPLPQRLKNGFHPLQEEGSGEQMEDHLIIVGYGLGGMQLASAAAAGEIDYIIIELNPETVKKEKAKGLPIFYGDAAQEEVLEHAGIENARVLVVAIPDMAATRRVVLNARHQNRGLHIIARTPFIKEIDALRKMGADEVIPAEFETSIEIFTRVLMKYLVPKSEIERFINDIRAQGYQVIRSLPSESRQAICNITDQAPGLEISTMTVEAGAEAEGRTLESLAIRKHYNVSVLLIKRGEEHITNPGGDTAMETADSVVMLGTPQNLARAAELFHFSE